MKTKHLLCPNRCLIQANSSLNNRGLFNVTIFSLEQMFDVIDQMLDSRRWFANIYEIFSVKNVKCHYQGDVS
ncbi:hypothetical protein HanOQP8_Chr04g0149341 [Helianthus annuus]|nr:hypothetical protein HanLR1_Chr04g0141951 [Helianthus annuus]KAJ0761393.1 hypothetical protein HanOQP8_Chr04g0149341 [Helianthus annuus]